MNTSPPNLLDRIAEEFTARLRAGESPSIDDYASRYDQLASDIHRLFPILAELEELADTETPAEPAKDANDPVIAKKLGNYRLLRVVGKGGMGVVYEANDESLGRRVAVKVLPTANRFDGNFKARFRREASAAAALHHTNIVPVFEFGEFDGVHYYAMQFIEGQGLDQILREFSAGNADNVQSISSAAQEDTNNGRSGSSLTGGNDPTNLSDVAASSDNSRHWSNVARIGRQVADALAYAHAQGVLHRDIKPANLLLDIEGNVWVTDFGLAKMEDEHDLTRTGDVIGTLRYVAPEGLSGISSSRSDIYALGLTLYEFAARRPAYDHVDQRKLMAAIERGSPPQLSRIQPRIARDLETIIHKAIAHEPSDRYASAAAMGDDLYRFLQDKPVRARRASAAEQLLRWCRRNPALATLAAMVMTLLIVACASLAMLAVNQSQHTRALTKEVHRAARAETAAVESEHLAKRRLVEAYHSQARAIRFSGKAGQRFDSLAALQKAVDTLRELQLPDEVLRPMLLELRNDAIASMVLHDLGRLQRLPASTHLFAVNDAFDTVATSDQQGNVIFTNLDGEPIDSLPRLGNHPVGRFSPDGRYFALHARTDEGPHRSIDGKYRLQLWDLRNKQVVLTQNLSRGAPKFGQSGRRLYWARGDQQVQVFDLETLQTTAIDVGTPVHYLQLSPDEQSFSAWKHRANTAHIFATRNGQPLHQLDHQARLFQVAWSPDNRQLACAVGDFRVHLWDAQTGERVAELPAHQAEVTSVNYSQDGSLLASHGWDRKSFLWDPKDQEVLLSIPGSAVRFSSDDSMLTYHVYKTKGCETGVWPVGGGHQLITLRETSTKGKGPKNISLHPDGRLVATASADGYRLWDLVHRRELLHFRDEPGTDESRRIYWLGDGAILTTSNMAAYVWPVQWRREQEKQGVALGPPTKLPVNGAVRGSAVSADGARLVIATAPYLHVFQIATLDRVAFEPIDGGAESINPALSPDGKWLTVRRMRQPFCVWNVETGEIVHEFGADVAEATGEFSPDGRWLATGKRDSCCLWEVGSWQPKHEFPRDVTSGEAMAFGHDGHLFAYLSAQRTIRLMDIMGGIEIAQFQFTKPGIPSGLCFSHDGARLLAITESHVIQIWNLESIQSELRSMGLAWLQPPTRSTPPRPDNRPLEIRLDYGELAR